MSFANVLRLHEQGWTNTVEAQEAAHTYLACLEDVGFPASSVNGVYQLAARKYRDATPLDSDEVHDAMNVAACQDHSRIWPTWNKAILDQVGPWLNDHRVMIAELDVLRKRATRRTRAFQLQGWQTELP
jgi:hypothetical protein